MHLRCGVTTRLYFCREEFNVSDFVYITKKSPYFKKYLCIASEVCCVADIP